MPIQFEDIMKLMAMDMQKNEPETRVGSGGEFFIDNWIGKYVIIRSGNEGVNAGFLEAAGVGWVSIRDARRLWLHRPSDRSMSWYEGVAMSGLGPDCRVSPAVECKIIVEEYSITPCSEAARGSIQNEPSNKQQ